MFQRNKKNTIEKQQLLGRTTLNLPQYQRKVLSLTGPTTMHLIRPRKCQPNSRNSNERGTNDTFRRSLVCLRTNSPILLWKCSPYFPFLNFAFSQDDTSIKIQFLVFASDQLLFWNANDVLDNFLRIFDIRWSDWFWCSNAHTHTTISITISTNIALFRFHQSVCVLQDLYGVRITNHEHIQSSAIDCGR